MLESGERSCCLRSYYINDSSVMQPLSYITKPVIPYFSECILKPTFKPQKGRKWPKNSWWVKWNLEEKSLLSSVWINQNYFYLNHWSHLFIPFEGWVQIIPPITQFTHLLNQYGELLIDLLSPDPPSCGLGHQPPQFGPSSRIPEHVRIRIWSGAVGK